MIRVAEGNLKRCQNLVYVQALHTKNVEIHFYIEDTSTFVISSMKCLLDAIPT